VSARREFFVHLGVNGVGVLISMHLRSCCLTVVILRDVIELISGVKYDRTKESVD